MTEPRRLLEDAGDDLARQLLDAGRDGGPCGPSPELQAQMWSGIEAALGPLAAASAGAAVAKGTAAANGTAMAGASASAGGAASGGASLVGAAAPAAAPAALATTSSGLGLAVGTKIGLAGLLLGGTLVTATVFRAAEQPPAPAPAAVVAMEAQNADRPGAERAPDRASAPLPHLDDKSVIDSPAEAPPPPAEAAARARDDRPESAAAPVKAVPGPSPAEPAKSASASNLVEEVAAVQKARTLLAQGSASQALGVLAELDKTIPRGSLGQERAILTIEALAASGQKGKAAQLAKAFLTANPSSPYAERVRSYSE